jgi:hypothetical protein
MKHASRDDLKRRWTKLETERSSWRAHWREISDYLLPTSSRFYTSDRNRGTRRHNNIFDSAGLQALKVLGAGMMAGMSSPARPWFRLTLQDRELAEYDSVKGWLADTQRRMLHIFATSNTYQVLHQVYMELGAFGTSAVVMMEDPVTTIHHYHSPIGEFALANDYRGRVNTLYREFEKTVGEIVIEFGYTNCSPTVRTMYDRGNLDEWVKIVHAIEPRAVRSLDNPSAMHKAYRSVYFEPSYDGGDTTKVLRESGFDDFPVMAPRWHRMAGDVYGHSPGMEALGDIKSLQHMSLRRSNVVDYQTKPPLQVPTSMRQREIDWKPGGVTFVDQIGVQNTVQPLFAATLPINDLLVSMQDARELIRSAFHADMFLMLANGDTTRMTATEVAARNEEKMLMIGPVLERLQHELLKPLIDRTFERMITNGNIMMPPEELQGVELDVEFVSVLAQAQRAIGVNSIDRYVNSLGVIAQMRPEVLDKIDVDNWADAYADMLGVDPDIIVPNDQVALIREQRAEQQQQMEQQAMMAQAAQTGQALGNIKTNESNAATDLLGMVSGYQAPPATEL